LEDGPPACPTVIDRRYRNLDRLEARLPMSLRANFKIVIGPTKWILF